MTKLHNLNPEKWLIFFYQEIQPFRFFNFETIFFQAYENSDFGVGGQIGGREVWGWVEHRVDAKYSKKS